ncbi:hypothetical protein Ahu01nite_078590 [Winogradskya humida]|uniref:Uncharacterized protein n=2 Tax=Winogradskya humida TaxID=113566 RepID=A0ABQ4A335_9ACTN|nr:hypothetical protein Ahu01nite_078590 [Actinoplanes humidus]
MVVVIGDYGRYAAIRDWHEGDIQRRPLRPADPAVLTGIKGWMAGTASVHGERVLAVGLTYLFGEGDCPHCGATFEVAAQREHSRPAEPDPWAVQVT